MNNNINKTPGTFQVVLAYLIVYIVWGSTYFFISRALHGFPPFMLGAIRFIIAGLLMMIWAIWKKENLLNRASIRLAAVSGFLVLFVGNGVVIFVEQYVGSAWVAIIISAAPLWYVVYDKPHWRENFSSKSILTGLFLGLIGIFLLFLPNISASYNIGRNPYERFALFALIVGSMSWVVGSLFAKYKKNRCAGYREHQLANVFCGHLFFSRRVYFRRIQNISIIIRACRCLVFYHLPDHIWFYPRL